ncbi:MAG TPA: sarcosine oxidase [Candidatus Angelobacter sp.]|nr:sarcosine oxidase [Candidatus Angelobacter sp.]
MTAAEASISPTALARRSCIYRVLQQAGARFAPINDAAIAVDFGRPVDAEAEQARRMGIADLSVLPRTGFKGAGTVEWLTAQGLAIGPDSNRAYPQAGGELAARLAPTEIFLIDGLAGTGELVRRLNAAWSWGGEKPRTLIGYPMPRSESHAWFMITGKHAPAMFAKICGVDLRLHRFAVGTIAQTSIAKMSGILIRADLGDTAAFHLLADSASAEYLWACVLDAMAEFDGAPVGLSALRKLAGGG